MNLTANTGVGVARGAAFLMLHAVSQEEGLMEQGIYQAYAPDPMVFEMIRKGTWVGRGSS